jgi:hypothetical protein
MWWWAIADTRVVRPRRSLRLEVPPTLLVIAGEVIE